MRKSKHSVELCSRIVKAGHRVYFIDAKVDANGERFVAISEVKHLPDSATRERQRVHIYEEDMPKFLDALGSALTALEEERKRRAGTPVVEAISPEAADALGMTPPTQLDIPDLEDIITTDE